MWSKLCLVSKQKQNSMISNIFEILGKLNKFLYCSEDYEDLRERLRGDSTTYLGNRHSTDLKEYKYQANLSNARILISYTPLLPHLLATYRDMAREAQVNIWRRGGAVPNGTREVWNGVEWQGRR